MPDGQANRLRHRAGLYGDVNSYEGRPTNSQIARTDVLTRELEDVIKEFRDLVAGSGIPILSEAEWQKSKSQ